MTADRRGFQSTPNLHGWSWGPSTITRICSDPKLGVWLEVSGQRERVEIRVTNGGRLRVGPVVKRKKASNG